MCTTQWWRQLLNNLFILIFFQLYYANEKNGVHWQFECYCAISIESDFLKRKQYIEQSTGIVNNCSKHGLWKQFWELLIKTRRRRQLRHINKNEDLSIILGWLLLLSIIYADVRIRMIHTAIKVTDRVVCVLCVLNTNTSASNNLYVWLFPLSSFILLRFMCFFGNCIFVVFVVAREQEGDEEEGSVEKY